MFATDTPESESERLATGEVLTGNARVLPLLAEDRG